MQIDVGSMVLDSKAMNERGIMTQPFYDQQWNSYRGEPMRATDNVLGIISIVISAIVCIIGIIPFVGIILFYIFGLWVGAVTALGLGIAGIGVGVKNSSKKLTVLSIIGTVLSLLSFALPFIGLLIFGVMGGNTDCFMYC